MHNGFLYLHYDFGFSTGPVLLEDSMKKAQINDAKFHEVEMQLQSIIAIWPTIPAAPKQQ